MRKAKLSIMLLCLLSLFVSCGDDKSSTAKNSKKDNAKSAETISSVVLYDGTPFYVENQDGKMVYADEAQLGDVIRIFLKGKSIEQKEAIRLLSSGKEETFNFVHVSYYDKSYWTRDIFITNDAAVTPAVITAQSITYSAPDGTKATSKKFEPGTIIAVNVTAKEHDLDLDIDFYEVTYYGGGSSPFGKKVYVKCDNISSNKADTVALQTLKKIENTKNINGDVKAILSESLNNLPVSPFVADKIAEAGL